MAYEIPGFSFPLPAGADFSAGAQFRFCDVSTTGKAVNPAAGGSVIGVRQTKSKLNEAATIVHSGVSIVEAGGVITAGDLLKTDATGKVLLSTAGAVTVGRALESASGTGIQIAVLLIPSAAQAV
jgi:hypothetical protein